MLQKDVTISRPQRWDVPFGANMSSADVQRLRAIDPFQRMEPTAFLPTCPLDGILLNDTRIVKLQRGDIVVREGDYGNSAFFVLEGNVRVALSSLPQEALGHQETKQINLFQAVARLFRQPAYPEVRKYNDKDRSKLIGTRMDGETTRIFLQDVPGILNEHRTLEIGPGEFFGELAALSRTARTATVFVDSDEAVLLEIRWQGLREMMKRDKSIEKHIHELYRSNSLSTHLRETPLLQHLSEEQLSDVVASTQFQTYGDFEWNRPYKQLEKQDAIDRIQAEPLIAAEGDYVDGLILIRSGFVRVSRQYGHGHQTISYLGKGESFGFEELSYNAKSEKTIPYQLSLRALGYVDILRIPTEIVERTILPSLPQQEIDELRARAESYSQSLSRDAELAKQQRQVQQKVDPALFEFLGQHQLINGTNAMLINMDRCTRCDDCVRACATSHNNNPRFVRQGPKHDKFMVASACMHCVDPVCMIGCPTGAIARDTATGNVLINDVTCIGCSTCANSCPYDNIQMVEIRDNKGRFILDDENGKPIAKATKCDLCTDQLGGPACQRACPHDALVRIDLRDTDDLSTWCNR